MQRKCKICGKIFDGTPDANLCPDCRLAAQRENVYRPRTCTICGASFVGTPRALYCPTCRAEVKRQRCIDHKRMGAARKLGSIDHCLRCGKEYTVTSGLQKYCRDCGPIAVREADREKSRAWNTAHKDITYQQKNELRRSERTCVICGAPITAKTCTVTCGREECRNARKKQVRQMAAYRAGRRSAPPENYVPSKKGNVRSPSPPRLNLTNMQFGQLTALAPAPSKKGLTRWTCRCSCGKIIDVYTASLTSGNTKSCGCSRKKKCP